MNFEKLNKYRVKGGAWATKDENDFGLFFVPTKSNAMLKVLSSGFIDQEWYHVSVSLPNRCPTWAEMCMIKDLFYSENDVVVQFHPKKSDYVNNHPFCLHLWKNMNQEFITPNPSLVGIKEKGTLI